MVTTRKLEKQSDADRNKLPGIAFRPVSSASTKSAQQKESQKYHDALMESYKPKNKLPAVARSTASRNSTDFESKKGEGDLHLPSISDIKSHHSS